MIEPGVQVSGKRSVGSANGWVITGDRNVVLTVDGHLRESVDVPATAGGASRLLFGPSRRLDWPLVGSWLRPDADVVATEPRREADELTRWCLSGRGPVIKLVRGAGGQGKTHLAGQVCQRLQGQGWLAGFVQLPPANWRAVSLAGLAAPGAEADRLRRQLRRVPELVAAIHAIADTSARALLVVDYAENVAPMVAELLDVIADAGAETVVRVLLLARTDQGWFRDLTEDHPLHDWVDPRPVVLEALSANWDGGYTAQVWTRAVAGFVDRAVEHDIPVDRRLAAESTAPARAFPTTLDLYADALLRVLDSGTGSLSDGQDAIGGVLAHERRQVSSGLHAAGLHLPELQRDWAMAAVALRAAADVHEGARVLAATPTLTDLDEFVHHRLAVCLHELYPDPADKELWLPPTPDRLTDSHLLDLARRVPSRSQWCAELARVCGTGEESTARRTVTVLTRCLTAPGHHRAAQDRIRAGVGCLIRGFPRAYVPVVTVISPELFTGELIETISGRTPLMPISDVYALDELLRELGFATARTAVAVAVSQRLVADAEAAAGSDSSSETLKRHARQLNNLAIRLGLLGRREEGLAASEEAVTICRRLAQENPAAYQTDLATSLNNLAVDLGELGRREEGLAASEEAVTVYRRLAEDHPAAYQPDLAMVLNNLAIHLGVLGRREEGLAASEEAVTIYRRLAEENPLAYQPDLAMALNNLAVDLGTLGRREDGLAASEEAVTVYRRLAQENPAAHQTDLATSLNNLAADLGELGRREEGLAASEEAVTVYRRLAEDHPAAYQPDLAMALNNLAIHLGVLGRREEGLAASEEAVTIYRRLAEVHLLAYQPDLAMAVNNLAVRLGVLGRREEGLAAIREAIVIRRQLAEDNPTAYLPNLATSLNNLSRLLDNKAHKEEAKIAAAETGQNPACIQRLE